MKTATLWCVAALASALACSSSAGPKRVGQQPSWRQTVEPIETRSPPAKSEPGAGPRLAQHAQNGGAAAPTPTPPPPPKPRALVFTPKSAPATTYNATSRGPLPSSPIKDAVRVRVDEICQRLGIPLLEPDPRLYRAADDMAGVIPEDAPLSYSLIEFALQRQGIIEPSPHMLPVAGSLDHAAPMIDQLVDRLPEILTQERVTRMGIGSARGKGPGDDLLVLLLQASNVQTKPIPREVKKNGTYLIEGKALGDYGAPDIFITREDGAVVREDIKRRGNQGFRARLSCVGRTGKQQVEITAENARGSTVLANFPVWCGTSAPTILTVEPSVDDLIKVKNGAEAEALMLQLVNRDRKLYKLAPLALSVDLSAVARAHSVEMRDTGVVAHTSATTGTAQDRVRRASIKTSLIMENIARAYGVGEAQDGLMNSPGHRSNLLSDKATHIGIGVAFKETESEGRIMFFTQLFMRVPPVLTAAEALAALRERVTREKTHVGERPELSAVAQEYVDRVIAPNMPDPEASRWRRARLDGLSQSYARVATAVVAVLDLESIDLDDAFSDKWITHYGLGVAKAPNARLGKDALYVVLVLGEAR